MYSKSRPAMLGILILLICLMVGNRADSQSSKSVEPTVRDTIIYYFSEPVIVTATMTERQIFTTPKAVNYIGHPELIIKDELSILDALTDQPGIWVEKRTTTTSDPVIRGMSGYNILALIDGHTLSTLWGEGGAAGDDMYGKIDADNIERIEVVRGPSSVLYGSNALAGVVNFITKSSPFDYTDEGFTWGARHNASFASAAREKRLRTEFYGATPRFRFIAGYSFRDVEDARAGRGIGLQVPTSGKEINWDFKGQFRLAENHELQASTQYVNRNNVYRFYRPNQTNFNDRYGISLRYDGQGVFSVTDRMRASVYYQYKKDKRLNFANDETGWAITKTYVANIRWSNTILENHRLTAGIHFELDDGESPDDEQLTRQSGETIRKDAPDSYWMNGAIFVQDEWEVASRVTIIGALRWDRFDFDSRPDSLYQSTGMIDPGVDDIYEKENTVTGGIGVSWMPDHRVNLFGNISRGFREYAPVFGIKQHAYGIQVPSGLLEPASSINYEIGAKLRSRQLRGGIAGYYSDLNNFPAVAPGTYMGQDWYDWDQSGTRDPGEDVFVTENSAKAHVYGIECWMEYAFGGGWSVYGTFNWNYGEDETNDEPFRHTVPPWGAVRVTWQRQSDNRIRINFSSEFAGSFDRIPSDRIYRDPGYRTDPQDMDSPLIGPNGEIPEWIIFNTRGYYDITDDLTLNAAVENITDRAYRRVHSRWDELGINVVIGLSYRL